MQVIVVEGVFCFVGSCGQVYCEFVFVEYCFSVFLEVVVWLEEISFVWFVYFMFEDLDIDDVIVVMDKVFVEVIV